MKALLSLGILSALILSVSPAPATAGYSDYYVKQMRNSQYDPPNTPYSITVGGPFSQLNDCLYEASADAREDSYHHLFQCSMGR
jgi:hypothetical protein